MDLYFSKKTLTPTHLEATVVLEDGRIWTTPLQTNSIADHGDHWRMRIPSPWTASLPLGYHQLHIHADSHHFQSLIISAPEKLESAPQLTHSWGPFVPLYALRTGSEWGLGSLKDPDRAENLR